MPPWVHGAINFQMTTFQFSDAPSVRHQVQARTDTVQVDGTEFRVRNTASGCFVTTLNGRAERLYAVAHGDAIYVQLRGRAWKIDKLDLTRSSASTTTEGAGACLAPMPGVVISVLASRGAPVHQGDALMVIESMKLQMTISAPLAGTVAELPFAVGQTFQRGAVLAVVQGAGVEAGGSA